MRKAIIPAITLSLLLSGCWDLTEAEKQGMVTLIGIDAADNQQVRVLVQEMSTPKKDSGSQEGSSGNSLVELHEAVAPTISDAVEKIITSSFRFTDFSHTYAIVLSEELVHSMGIRPFIDFLERAPTIRRNVWLLIAKEGMFDTICNPYIAIKSNSEPGKVIMEIIHNKPESSIISANTLGDFLNLLWERGSDPYTSGIDLVEKGSSSGNQGATSDVSDFYGIRVEDTAVFKKEKLAGWLNNIESKGLLWVKGDIKGGTLTVNMEGKELSLRIMKAGSKIKPKINGEKMEVDITITVETNLGESRADLDFADVSVINDIQNLQAEEIKKQILAAYEKSKQLDSDVFGFGNYFFGKYPKVWKQIETNNLDYYHKIKLNIDVSSKVNNIGLVKKAISIDQIY